jgi:hypothetical protein
VDEIKMPDAESERTALKIDPYYKKLFVTVAVIGVFGWLSVDYITESISDLEQNILRDPNFQAIGGGRKFWTMTEAKLYKLADEPDLPPEQKEKIVKALQKLAAKYRPYINALSEPPPTPHAETK